MENYLLFVNNHQLRDPKHEDEYTGPMMIITTSNDEQLKRKIITSLFGVYVYVFLLRAND